MQFSGKEHPYVQNYGEMFPQSKVVIEFVNCTSLGFCCTMPEFGIALFGPFITSIIISRILMYIFGF